MEENNNVVEMKKESKVKKFMKSKKVRTCVQIVTTCLTVLNTIVLALACTSSMEAEVNADVMPEYNEMKGVDTKLIE